MDLVRDMGGGPAEEPLRRLGKYELIERLAQGGMAEVYLARLCGPMNFQKEMVVKIIHPHLAVQGEFLRMLFDEARLSALIKHPQVVDIYELGCEDGTYFLAMEHIDGQPLSAILREGARGKPLGPLPTARVIADAAAGLHAAHELRSPEGELLGLVHRDMSPGNIMVRYDGGVKIVDFGIAKARGRLAVSMAWQFKGKAGYVAPEQLQSRAVDRRTDVFGLGIVLWEALTLQRLSRAASGHAAVRDVFERRAPSPTEIRPEVPADLSEICLRAMQPDPDDRYQTADDMRRALEQALMAHGFYRESGEIERYMQRVFCAGREDTAEPELRPLTGGADGSAIEPGAAEDDFPELEVSDQAEEAGSSRLARGSNVESAVAKTAPPPRLPVRAPPRRRRRVRPIFAVLGIAAVVVCTAAVLVDRDEWLAAASAWLDHGHEHVPAATVQRAAPAPEAPAPAAQERSEPEADEAVSPEVRRQAIDAYDEGIALFVDGDDAGAKVYLEQAVALDGRFAPAHRGLALVCAALGQRDEARRALARYLELRPDAADADIIRERVEGDAASP